MEVINTFEPEVLYADGDQQEKDALSDYWGSKDFLAWLYNDSPVKETVAVNDRWGISLLLFQTILILKKDFSV